MELGKSRTPECSACDRVQKAEVLVKALENLVAASYSKYSKTVVEAAQVKKELRTRVTSLVSELKAENDCTSRFEEDCIDENAEDSETVAERQKALDTLEDQLRGKEGTLRQMQT